MTATQTSHDPCAVFDPAITRANELLGYPLIEDHVDPHTYEIIPIVIMTNNSPAMKSLPVTNWF